MNETASNDSTESRESNGRIPTASQLEIITHPCEPNTLLKVKAGPGSGKTFTLAHRIAHLIKNRDIKPSEVLVLSMSNRAVNNIQKTLAKILDDQTIKEITVNTFHSFSSQLIDEYSQFYYKDYRHKRLMDDLSWRNFSNIFSGKVISLDGESVQGSITPASLEKVLSDIKIGKISVSKAASEFQLNEAYLKLLIEYMNKNGFIRYNDLIINALELIQDSLDQLNEVDQAQLIPTLSRYKVVIVDEFQDMYHQLLSIIHSLVKYPTVNNGQQLKHLTIAGDPNQSIYEFLGSKPELMDFIDYDFPSFQICELSINETFRLTSEISEMSSKIAFGTDSNIISSKGQGELPIIRQHYSQYQEYIFIIEEIIRLIFELGGLIKPADCIILTRYNKDIDEISKIMSTIYDLNFEKLTSGNEWIKTKLHCFLDILYILNQNAGFEFSLLSLLLKIDNKIGNRGRISKLFNEYNSWMKNNQSRSLEDYLNEQLIQDSTKNSKILKLKQIYKIDNQSVLNKINSFLKSIQDERNKIFESYNNAIATQDHETIKNSITPTMILESIFNIAEALGILDYINEPDSQGKHKVQDNKQIEKDHKYILKRWLYSFNSSLECSFANYVESNKERTFLDHFLRNCNDECPIGNQDTIKLSTIHTAKGLEYPIVFIVGLSKFGNKSYWESLLTNESNSVSKDLSKSRLFYVASTRAQSVLYLGSTKPIDELSSEVQQTFTNKLPQLLDSSKLMSNLLTQLQRPLPHEAKLKSGLQSYHIFKSRKQNYCTSSKNFNSIECTSSASVWPMSNFTTPAPISTSSKWRLKPCKVMLKLLMKRC